LNGILRGLTQNRAATDPTSPDRRLKGRTYAIPFEDVWNASVRLASRELRRWSLLGADDQEGVIEAEAHPILFGGPCRIRIEIGLDENAQTRVDAWSSTGGTRGDLGRSRRTLGRFFRALDRALEASPGQILDPTCQPAWLQE
jgi:hypothetical protein